VTVALQTHGPSQRRVLSLCGCAIEDTGISLQPFSGLVGDEWIKLADASAVVLLAIYACRAVGTADLPIQNTKDGGREPEVKHRISNPLTVWWNRLSPAVRFALAVTLSLRVALSAWVAAITAAVPMGPMDPARLEMYHGTTPIVDGAAGLWLGAWQRWDATWYLRIVEQGYHTGDPSLVFPPLYPILTRLVAALPGFSPLLAGMLVSTAAAFVAFTLMYRLASGDVGQVVARRAVVYLAIFPWAYFLMAPYSESLFLATTLAAFLFARQRRWWLAGLLGAAAALTRVQGLLLLLPLAYELVVQARVQDAARRGARFAYFVRNAAPLTLIPLALACFAGYLYFAIGDQTLWANLGGDEWKLHFAFPWQGVVGSIQAIVRGSPSPLYSFPDLAVTILFGTLTVLTFRRLGAGPGLYMAAMLLVPMTKITPDDRLASMPRYVLVLYPGFMILAMAGERQWVNRIIVFSSVLLLCLFAMLFTLWQWTG
jgi:hypothetical protein